jgi:hypothetical protein
MTILMLGTEMLAASLIRPDNYPALSDEELADARSRLTNAFQAAWLAECRRLREAGALRFLDAQGEQR